MGAVTFRYYYVFRDTNQPSYDPGLTSRCGWTAKTNPPVEGLGRIFVETEGQGLYTLI